MSRAKKIKKNTELTPKQLVFCQEYLIDLNATQAAIRAGYSKKTAMQQAHQLLEKPLVREHLQKLMDKRSKKTEITAERILKELMLLATADLSEAYNEDGTLKRPKDMPEGVRRAISQIAVFEEFEQAGGRKVHCGDTKSVKFWDKNKSLELLGRHLKLFTDKVEHDVSGSLAQLIESSWNRDE